MSATFISFLVLRVSNIDKGADFYSALGLELTKHAHEEGPERYAAEIGNAVFELPLPNQLKIAGNIYSIDQQFLERNLGNILDNASQRAEKLGHLKDSRFSMVKITARNSKP